MQKKFYTCVWSIFTCVPFALTANCTSIQKNTPIVEQKYSLNKQSHLNQLERFMARVEKEPLRQYEVDEAFLIAESLTQEKQIETAEKLYRAIFEVSPSIVVGLKLTRILAISNKISEAEIIVRRLNLLFPKNPEPALTIAYLAQIKGNKNEALDIYAMAYKNHPKNEEVAIRYTEFLLEDGKKNAAKTVLVESLKRMPQSPYFLLKLARIRAEDHDYKDAKNLLDKLLRNNPDSIEGWTLAGYIASEENNFEAAERYFREAYEKQPENDLLARYYISQLLRQSKFQDASRLLARLESSADQNTPLDPELLFQFGLVLFQLEEYSEARKRFSILLSKAPDPGRINFYIAQCDELLKNFNSAMDIYNKIESSSDFYKQSLQRIIYLNLENGDLQKTQLLLNSYQLSKDDGESGYRFIASMYAKLKNYASANTVLEKGLFHFPHSKELNFLKAVYLEFTKSKESSLIAMEKFIGKSRDYPPALNHLGYSLAESGKRIEFALSLLKAAVEKEPKNGFYLDSLGWAYFRNAKISESEKYLLLGLQNEPDEPIILEHLGEVKLFKKEYDLALKYFQRADSVFKSKPQWKIDSDPEWKMSNERVKKKIMELHKRALPADSSPSQSNLNSPHPLFQTHNGA